jgi:hypothetical protein
VPDKDLLESEPASARVSEFRRRLELLVPAMVSRTLVAGIAAATLVLGLVAGFLVGNGTGTADPQAAQTGAPPDGDYIPIVPEGSPLDEVQSVIVLSTAVGSLTNEDMASAGEVVSPTRSSALVVTSGLAGLCGIVSTPDVVPLPEGPGVGYGVLGSVAFQLADATLAERIGPNLDVLAASTLRATVELVRSCSTSDDPTVTTEGIQAGIGDEYAVFTVGRPDAGSGVIATSIVALVRVGGQLVELTLSPEGRTEVTDGLARALRIAEVAVMRILAG